MTAALSRAFINDAEASLERKARTLVEASTFDRLLHACLSREESRSGLGALMSEAARSWNDAQIGQTARSYKHVAACGLALAFGGNAPVDRFAEGVDWVLGASIDLDGIATGLSGDPAAIIAVALGLERLGDATRSAAFKLWIARVRTTFGGQFSAWEQGAIEVALALADAASNLPRTPSGALIRAAFGRQLPLTSAETIAVLGMCVESAGTDDEVLALILLAALRRLRSIAVASIGAQNWTIDDVAEVLAGIPRALQEWTWEEHGRSRNSEPRKWHVDHEYHVQNLLWTVLAPLFPDLRREEFGTQVSLIQPRLDLAIPSLQLIIEAKFVRSDTPLKRAIEEISTDSGLYFAAGSDYEHLIAFVWDEGQRSEQHSALVRGIEQLPRVRKAIAVSRPGKMIRTTAQTTSSESG